MPPYFRHPSSLDHDTGPGHPERADRIRALEAELERARLARLGAARGAAGERGAAARGSPAGVRRRRGRDERPLGRVRRGHPHEPRLLRGGAAGGGRRLRAGGDACWAAASARASRRCARRDTTPSTRGRWASACSRTWRWPPGTRSTRSAPSGCFVLDWDVHHGNGTNTIFHGSREVLFCSIHQYPFWPGSGPLEDVARATARASRSTFPCPAGAARTVFLSLVEHVCVPVARQFGPDLILISAGLRRPPRRPARGAARSRRLLRRDGAPGAGAR